MAREDVHVTTHDGDNDKDSGIAAIIKAFIRNPAAAVQLVGFLGGLYGIYWAMENEIKEVRAAQVINGQLLNIKLDALSVAQAAASVKIEAVYSRGDIRYSNIIAKLSSHDVDIAKLVTGVDFVVDQIKADGINVRAPKITPSTPAAP